MTETSRTFDLEHGAIYVGIRDSFGKESFHTFYVAGLHDVEAEIQKRIQEVEQQAQMIRGHFVRTGWKG